MMYLTIGCRYAVAISGRTLILLDREATEETDTVLAQQQVGSVEAEWWRDLIAEAEKERHGREARHPLPVEVHEKRKRG